MPVKLLNTACWIRIRDISVVGQTCKPLHLPLSFFKLAPTRASVGFKLTTSCSRVSFRYQWTVYCLWCSTSVTSFFVFFVSFYLSIFQINHSCCVCKKTCRLSGFGCAFNPAVPGSNPKHTNYSFSHYILLCHLCHCI